MKDGNLYILKGDVNGIQNFIYNVYQGQGGVAKILRARSFLISIIPYAVLKILKDLLEEKFPGKYTLTPDPDVKSLSDKFLINEGGGFTAEIEVNVPDKEFKDFIENFKFSIEKFFIQELQGELGLSLAYVKSENSNSFSEVYTNLEISKKRKFSLYLEKITQEPPILDKAENRVICPVCRTFFKEESEEMCKFCQEMKTLGEKLTKYGNFDIKRQIDEFDIKIYTFKLEKEGQNSKEYFLVLNRSTGKEHHRLITVPVISKNITEKEIHEVKQELDVEELSPGTIAPFELIAEASRGDPKLGYLVVDVDNLGLIFQSLKDKETRKYLSKRLNEFFTFKVSEIALENFRPTEVEVGNKNLKKILDETLIYILYSGGDDLFAIGPWDKIIDFAIAINKEFLTFKKELVSNERLRNICHLVNNLTLSAGLAVVKPKFTVRVAAEWCKDAEDLSKSLGKNRITLFGETLKWEHFESTVEDAKCWSNLVEEGEVPRRFIYRFYKLYLDLIYYPQKFKQTKYLEFYPRIYYLIARTLDKKYRSVATSLVEKTLNENEFGIKIFCNYVLTATRRR